MRWWETGGGRANYATYMGQGLKGKRERGCGCRSKKSRLTTRETFSPSLPIVSEEKVASCCDFMRSAPRRVCQHVESDVRRMWWTHEERERRKGGGVEKSRSSPLLGADMNVTLWPSRSFSKNRRKCLMRSSMGDYATTERKIMRSYRKTTMVERGVPGRRAPAQSSLMTDHHPPGM